MFHGKALEVGIAVALGTSGLGIVVLVRRRVGEQLLKRLTLGKRRAAELLHPRNLERLLHLRVGPTRNARARSRNVRYSSMFALADSQTPSRFSVRSGL